MSNIVDLTQTFDDNMPVYPGDPTPELRQTANIQDHGYIEYCLHTGMHVGTHMDAPLHMLEGGAFLSEMPVEHFLGRGVLVDARNSGSIEASLLDSVQLQAGDIVLVLTGWYKRFRSPGYYDGYPEVSSAFARRLVEAGVSILGLDTPSPDSPPFPVHKILLTDHVLIVENLTNLESLLLVKSFEVIALPAKFRCEGAPARVVAKIHS